MKQKFFTLLTVALGCVVLFSKSAHAEPLKYSYATLFVGQGADIATTIRNLPAGGGRCIEMNSGYFGSQTPSAARVIAGKAVVLAPTAAAMWLLQKHHNAQGAKVLGYVMGSMGGGFAAWNLTRTCR